MCGMIKFLLPLFALSLFRAAGCHDPASDSAAVAPVTDCGPAIQVRNPLPRLTSDGFTVVSAEATGRCLTVTISATGCSTENWQVNLWANEETAADPANTPGGLLVFDDGVGADEMTCQAIMEATYQFDLSPYLPAERLPATFALTGTETTVTITADR